MSRLILGVGYNSEGKYQARPIDGDNFYSRWYLMLQRCYGSNQKKSYKGCTMSLSFLDFQNFAEFMHNNRYETYDNEPLAIDKDILFPGNREYSAEKCLLVPQKINNYFVGSNMDRRTHSELIHGIQLSARHFVTGKVTKIGRFTSIESAREAWAKYKSEQLREVVIPWFIDEVKDEYRDTGMVKKVINALENYRFS